MKIEGEKRRFYVTRAGRSQRVSEAERRASNACVPRKERGTSCALALWRNW
ncbi:MAG: hypothetical protein JST54_31010 [Deltaproteobacteria bacterium]|nr:hypothetical protein [Deltaproteobacteria bacterium]